MLGDQRGIVLPLTLVALAIILALTVTFSSYAALEPTIAANLQASVLAHSAADAGFERTIWALSHCASTGPCADSNTMIRNDLSNATAAAPYDGATSFPFNTTASFSVKAWQWNGANPDPSNMYRLEVIGQAAATTGQGSQMANPKFSQRKIWARLQYLRPFGPATDAATWGAAVTPYGANGDGSNTSTVSADHNNNCSAQNNTSPYAIYSGASITNASKINANGDGGNNTKTDATSFPYLFTKDEWGLLRTLARNGFGTYVRQGSGTYGSNLDGGGNLVFDSTHPLPSQGGLVFIDPSTSFSDATIDAVNGSDTRATVIVKSLGATWYGWLIVNGDLTLTRTSGNPDPSLNGLTYAAKSLTLNDRTKISGIGVAGGGPYLTGPVTEAQGGLNLYGGDMTYGCQSSRNGGSGSNKTAIPQRWFVVPGTYQEVSN
ncbi:MAG: hypothetical protein HY294_06145 [Candidatus Rokubacteria bacterium]|nr:hypothetical protein [Candidatus Rokubacteria bacterium]